VSYITAGVQLLWAVAVRSCWLRTGTVRKPRRRGTSAIESQYRATASEKCNRLRRLSVSYSDLWSIVLVVYVCSKSDYQSKPRLYSLYHITTPLERLNRSSWNTVYVLFHLRSSQWHTSQILAINNTVIESFQIVVGTTLTTLDWLNLSSWNLVWGSYHMSTSSSLSHRYLHSVISTKQQLTFLVWNPWAWSYINTHVMDILHKHSCHGYVT
jgi:hypothetical protein